MEILLHIITFTVGIIVGWLICVLLIGSGRAELEQENQYLHQLLKGREE